MQTANNIASVNGRLKDGTLGTDAYWGGAFFKDGSRNVDYDTRNNNIFNSHYIGKWNPKDNSGRWNYDLKP